MNSEQLKKGTAWIIKSGAFEWDEEEGLKIRNAQMWPGIVGAISEPDRMFNHDTFIQKNPETMSIIAHGGGGLDLQRVFTGSSDKHTWGGFDEQGEHVQNMTAKPELFGDGLNTTFESPEAERLFNEHKAKIKRVIAISCNGDGTCGPETYEKLLGDQLNSVAMVPKGKLGLGSNTVSGYLTKLLSKSNPENWAEMRNYEQQPDNSWQDTGMYKTKLDRFGEVAVPVGLGGLAYASFKSDQNYKKKHPRS